MKKTNLLPCALLAMMSITISCEEDIDRTEILYVTTINVLESQTLPYTLDEGQRIAGFYLGFDHEVKASLR